MYLISNKIFLLKLNKILWIYLKNRKCYRC